VCIVQRYTGQLAIVLGRGLQRVSSVGADESWQPGAAEGGNCVGGGRRLHFSAADSDTRLVAHLAVSLPPCRGASVW